jgi:hypothetical protein
MVAPGQTLVAATPVSVPTAQTARSRRWWAVHWSTIVAPAVAGILAVITVLMRWRGSDLPAHFFRVGLVERDGLVGWNNYWFGGHHTLGYGVLFPVLGSLVGIWTVAVASAALSALLVDILIRRATGHPCWWASLWFAVGTMTNVAIGRLPFALGLVVALGALVAAQHRRLVLAALLTVATAAASPVVSVFLVLIFAAWALTLEGRERRSFAILSAAAIAPVLIVSKLYPQGGMFPFRWTALLWTLAVCAVVLVLVPARYRLVRIVAVLYGLASIAAFLVPTPLGANITRLGMYAAAPVLLTLVPLTVVVALAVFPPLFFWQWSPAFDAILRARQDPSIEEAYYRPLLKFFASVDAEKSRVEVVPTGRHWETAFVATEVPIARGWERQLDRRFHPFFYDGTLTGGELHQWLRESGVGYVALADTTLDDSGVEEAALIEANPPYLRLVWQDQHWRVWRVIDSTGLIDGPAKLNELGVESVSLEILAPGDVLVRVRSSAFWSSDPAVCIEPTDDGWIVLRDVRPGPLELTLDETALVDGDDPCQS